MGVRYCGVRRRRRERRGEYDQSCHVLEMVENCGDGRTGARGRERGSFELCGALEGGRGVVGSSPSSQPFGVWSGGVGGRATRQCAGEESCKRIWEEVPLTSTALDRIVVTVLVQNQCQGAGGRSKTTTKTPKLVFTFLLCRDRSEMIRTRWKFSSELVSW